MRNLKRVLSLAMASVMLIGMMVVGAGAASVKDADKITHKEAADVLGSINVMVGDNNGNFNPEAILTREQAAKIVTYLLMGKDAADNLTAAKAPFTDVKADRWSAGSIAYCVKQGILAGMGDGTFQPEANVTGTQFAKMLLTAIGYSAKYEGLVGNGYELNVAKLVRLAGLNNNLSIVLSNELTRDSAAQMALNTLRAFTVEYSGGGSVVTGDTDVTLNATRYIGTTDAERFMAIYQKSLSYKAATTGAFERPSHTWKNGVTEIGKYASKAQVTYTAATKESVVKSDLDGYSFDASSIVYVNGANTATVTTMKEIADFTGNGRLVEIYTANDKVNTIVVVDTVLAKITSINTVTGKVMLTVQSQSGPSAQFPTMSYTVNKSDSETKYNQLVELGKDAMIAVTLDDGAVAGFNAAATVTGKYTNLSSTGKRTIDGTAYDDAYGGDKTATTSKISGDMTPGNTYTVYLDNYGYILGGTAVAESAAKTGFVVDTTEVGDKIAGVVYKAKVLFEDGTQEWVTVANIDIGAGAKAPTKANNDSLMGGYVTYSVNSEGNYSLKKVVSNAAGTPVNATGKANTAYQFSGATITANTVKFVTAGAANLANVSGSSKTIFLVGSTDGSYKVYTGIKNVPSFTNVSGTVLVGGETALVAGSGTATMVVIYDGATLASKDYVYISNAKYDQGADGNGPVYTYQAVLGDGTIGTITTTVNKDSAAANLAVGLYQVKSYSNGNASVLDPIANGTDAAPSTYIKANTATVGNGTVLISGSSLVMNDKFFCVAVNSDGSGAATIEPDDFKYYDNVAAKTQVTSVSVLLDSTGSAAGMFFTYTILP